MNVRNDDISHFLVSPLCRREILAEVVMCMIAPTLLTVWHESAQFVNDLNARNAKITSYPWRPTSGRLPRTLRSLSMSQTPLRLPDYGYRNLTGDQQIRNSRNKKFSTTNLTECLLIGASRTSLPLFVCLIVIIDYRCLRRVSSWTAQRRYGSWITV